ncbi:Chalcone isomerase-like [Modicisalibacter ilicicola DSM 19980]|uniref:Chalcone isomerase-like n=1 Tax=Modicisalibacter ilicicola DSM 19980 TaxID=1121942 RepID=A0A1M5AGP1_9GAMM|nr:chalcone isomerase family protein [Halomonas ilicicola]SHF29296.1 Chalcone isomerase-like [Halomonas ilicicola DSM 19980]
MPMRALLGRGPLMLALCWLLAASSAAAQAERSVRVEGVEFPTRITIDDRPYQMLGSGLFTYMIWDAYVGAYYQASGFPRPAPVSDVPRHLVLEYFHAIDAEDFADTTRKGVKRNLSASRFAGLTDPLQAFNASYRDVVPGDRYALTWTGDELRLSLNDEVLHRSDNEALAAALFAIWLGDNPAKESFKQALLGN